MNITMGEALRQLRRQQGLTQSELGGEQFSKSYISAVEHDKIVPSYEAIHHFAWRLGQDRDYFAQFLLQPKVSPPSSAPSTSFASSANGDDLILENALTLLDILEKDIVFPSQYPLQEGFVLPSNVLATLSKERSKPLICFGQAIVQGKGATLLMLSPHMSLHLASW